MEAHHRLLRQNPLHLETYKELRRLYGAMQAKDKEWCVAAVLALLKKASDDELTLYRQHRQDKPRRVGRKHSEDLWRDHLYHPWQDRTLSRVLTTVAPIVAPMAAKPLKVWGLKSRLDPTDSRAYARVASSVCQVLDVSAPEMYLRGGTTEPAGLFLAGRAEEAGGVLWLNPVLVESSSETELTFWLTRTLAQWRQLRGDA